MAYSIQVSGQLQGKKADQSRVVIDSENIELKRRELCSNSLFKKGSYDYLYYFSTDSEWGCFKWVVNVSSHPQRTQIIRSHLYKYPADIDIELDVEFIVSEVKEGQACYQADVEAT